MRKYLIPVLVVAALAVAAYVSTGVFVSEATPKPAPSSPLIGEYHQINDTGSAHFNATVSDGKIKITLRLHDPSQNEGDADPAGTYWVGSLDTNTTSNSFTDVSSADKKALEYSILGSRSDTKAFTYNNGVLSFRFSMDAAGIDTTVHLSK